MDDPWGSPWAATDSDKDQKLALPAKSDLAPPPRAFLSASSSPRIPAVVDQSPWAGDNDGFGEWTTTSDGPSVQAVWAGGWGASSPNLTPTPRDDTLSKASPIAWPGALATPKPTNGSAFRQPSPDPWASGFSSRRPSNAGTSTPRLMLDAPSPVDATTDTDGFGKDGLGIEVNPGWDAPDVDHTSEQTAIPSGSDPASHDLEQVGGSQAESRPGSAPGSDVRLSVESLAQSREYPSTTPSNDNTDHEDERQGSPITSIDEEPRARPLGSRKVSGKVQELVVKFDGLARAESPERIPVQRGRSMSPLRVGKRSDRDVEGDFGDFEDADQDGPPMPRETQAETEPNEEPIVVAARAASSSQPTTRQPSTPSPIAQFGPINFDVDLSLVSKLFDATAPKAAGLDAQPDREISDHIISDSFTEISERKTWYRISRLGSSRRHHAADDDSYRRVLWRTSTVHDDTIKIVRRWMEEDSIAGRVTLGGGISKTQKNMFGWDSSAAPVALDAVFGRRKSLHNAPITPLSPVAGGSAMKSLRGPAHRPSGSAGPAIASFGWSSGLPASGGQTQTSNTIPGPPNATAAPTPCAAENEVSSAIHPKQPTTTPHPILIPPLQSSNQVDNDDDDDDDDDDDEEWGEMVSSPVVTSHVTNSLTVSQPASVPVSAIPEPETGPEPKASVSGDANLDTPSANDPWGSADFSLFESGPPQPPLKANTLPTIPSPTESLDRGPTPASGSAAPAKLSTLMTAIPDPPTPTTTDPPTRPSTSTKVLAPLADADSLADPHQNDIDEAARRIIANLPDLSYMLC